MLGALGAKRAGRVRQLSANVAHHVVDGIDVIGDGLVVGDLDSEPRLEEMHQLDNADGIDDPAMREGGTPIEVCGVLREEEVIGNERTDLLLERLHRRPRDMLRSAGARRADYWGANYRIGSHII